jgi:hypothetical protein
VDLLLSIYVLRQRWGESKKKTEKKESKEKSDVCVRR